MPGSMEKAKIDETGDERLKAQLDSQNRDLFEGKLEQHLRTCTQNATRTHTYSEYIKTKGGYVLKLANNIFNTAKFKVYFTGHAIEGVIQRRKKYIVKDAILPAIPEIAVLGLKFIAVTFGQSRIGSIVFAEYINHKLEVQRVKHSNDFISNFMINFSHNHIFRHHEMEYRITLKNCQCPDSNLDQFNLAYDVFQCPEYWSHDLDKAGENRNCNSGTDGHGTSVHFGPYFNTTFKDCHEFLPPI
ncbi:hypothetical protein G9A89_023264 [Geosiphon pyriformis]|nr:hypothetical protein G9A89_023264 [Geosiphon pyriformis]